MKTQKLLLVMLLVILGALSTSLVFAQEDPTYLPLIANGSAPTPCPTDSVATPGGCATITPTPTHTDTATPTITPTFTPTACPTDSVLTPGGCATITPTNTPTPTMTPTQPTLDGLWKGATSQGKEISFRVRDHGFQTMSVDYFFNFGSCSLSGPVFFFRATPIPFSGNTFSVPVTSRTTTAGTFTSDTAASGTLEVKINEFGCSGTGNATWNATKQ